MTLSPIKLARMRGGLRQIDIARKIGVSESQLSKIETGRIEPSGEILARIAEVLRVDEDELR